MVKVFTMYKLKPGVNIADYIEFSTKLDQRVTPRQPGVHKFEVYQIQGSEKGEIMYQIVEVVEVESVKGFKKVLESKEMEKVEERYYELVDQASVKTLYGEIIT